MAASNLAQRAISALIALPAMLALIYLGPPWAWALFVGLACAIGSVELYGMSHPDDRAARMVCAALTLGTYALLWFAGGDARALVALVLLLPLASLLLALARLGDVNTAALRIATSTFGPLYLGGGLASAALVRRDAGVDGPGFVMLALMLSWLSDTFAYFAGRFLGKRKLYEAVSPKKTVAGALGGLVGAAVGALLASFVYLRSLPVLDGLVLALLGGVLGQLGDLGESLLKRSFGVKDSGAIVPGHGGILDRVDALMVTSTLSYLYLVLFRTG